MAASGRGAEQPDHDRLLGNGRFLQREESLADRACLLRRRRVSGGLLLWEGGGGSGLRRTEKSSIRRRGQDGQGVADADNDICYAGAQALLPGWPHCQSERVQNQITGRRLSIGARYDQYEYLDEKRRALELWERRLLEIVEGRKASGERWLG